MSRRRVVLLALRCGASLSLRAGEAGRRTPPLAQIPFGAERAKALQQEWARALGQREQVANSLGMKFVLIPGGRFTLGPSGSTYRVTLARPFYLGVTEVTLGHYRQFKPAHRAEGAAAEFNTDDRPAGRGGRAPSTAPPWPTTRATRT
jgi:formylglycine-generating enzyme required for sulfatase activity